MRFTLLAIAAIAIATPAVAEPNSVTLTITSADFATPTALARLDRRIGAAVEQVCGSYAAIESSQVPEMDACWISARDQARQQLGRVDSLALAGKSKLTIASSVVGH
jgi:UrcA family protein